MKKKYKTDYFYLLTNMMQCCVDASDGIKNTDCRQFFDKVKTNIHKDYFAPFEREDIFLLATKIYDLYIFTDHINLNNSDSNIILTIKTNVKMLYELISMLKSNHETIKMPAFINKLTAIESTPIPDAVLFSDNKHRYFLTDIINKIKDIAVYTEYIIIKNS